MREELDKKLCKEFPLLYRDRYANPSTTCMCWGFPQDGWFQIIYDLSSKLEPLIEAQPEGERARAAQVKEKFGEMRFYIDGGTREMYDLIGEAEEKSTITCEFCGEPGELRDDTFWLKTLCEKCNRGRMNDRRED